MQEWVVIATKYGYIVDAVEDYTDLIEGHPLEYMYNLTFSDDVNRACKFSNIKNEPPKYAHSKIYDWRTWTIEDWAKEIDGEILYLKIEEGSCIDSYSEEFVFSKIKRFIVEKGKFNTCEFINFPYEGVEDLNYK